MRVQLYCDGGCRGNQERKNIGGWGAYLIWGASTKELYGGMRNTTNNIMELTGAIEGLRAITRDAPVDVYVDSAYVYNGITDWIDSWQAKGWKNAKKDPVANKQLWLELLEQKNRFSDIVFHKVKGHADDEGNNHADLLANRAMDEIEAELASRDGGVGQDSPR